MLKSGPSTSSGQSSSSPHIVARGVRVLYCKYETVKGYIFGEEYTLREVGRELCCVDPVIPENYGFRVVRVTMGMTSIAVFLQC